MSVSYPRVGLLCVVDHACVCDEVSILLQVLMVIQGEQLYISIPLTTGTLGCKLIKQTVTHILRSINYDVQMKFCHKRFLGASCDDLEGSVALKICQVNRVVSLSLS